MQPIALNIEVIKTLIDDWTNYNIRSDFFILARNLKDFHIIFIDEHNRISKWLEDFKKFRNSIGDDDIRKMIDELIGPKNLKYHPVQLKSSNNLIFSIAEKTPEKIGLHTQTCRKEELRFYNLSCFNTNEFDSQNYLFRIPKTITIKPGEKFDDLRLFSPYVRNAKKLEFCDLFLFKNTNATGEVKFLLSILQISDCLEEVIFHCEPNPLNIAQKKIEKDLKSIFRGKVSCEFRKYNPPTKDVNHDRFIIIDNDKFSIRFTTSFNNLRLSNEGKLIVRDSFLIEFSRGRKYFD